MRKFRLHPLFDGEGEIGASSAPETTITPSVAAGVQETPGAGNALAPVSPTAPTIDVTQQQSFADRLKEERTKIETEYAPYKTHVSQMEKIAKASGFATTDEYIIALESHVQEEAAAAEAHRLGVDPETYKTYFAPVHEKLNKAESALQTLRQSDLQRQITVEHEQLKKEYPDFADVEVKVFDMAEKRGFSLSEAYKLVSFDNRVAAAKLSGQNEAIEKLKLNANSSPGAAGGDAPNQSFDFTKLTREQRAVYYDKAKRGELKSLS